MDLMSKKMYADFLEKEREEQMIDRIADRVLQRLLENTDIQEVITDIQELKKALKTKALENDGGNPNATYNLS